MFPSGISKLFYGLVNFLVSIGLWPKSDKENDPDGDGQYG